MAYTNSGIVYRKKGDNDRASADCSQAIKLNPRDADAYVLRGVAYEQEKLRDQAAMSAKI